MPARIMTWLDQAMRLVLVQIMTAALTLAGLVVLGAAPAAAAAAAVVGPIRRDEPLPIVPTMWRTWRAQLVRANLAAAPSAVLGAAACLNLLLLAGREPSLPATLLGGLCIVVAVGSVLTWVVTAVLVTEEQLSPFGALRTALAFVIGFPGTALALLVCLAGLAVISVFAPILAVLAGASGAMLITQMLVSTRRQILVEDLAGA